MKNLKLLCDTTRENPKCHMHIPQSKKNIYVLNIIIQSILEKKKMKKKDTKGTPKTLMPPIGVQKPNGSKNLKGNFKRNQVAHLWG